MNKSTRLTPDSPLASSMIGQKYGRLTVTAFAGWRVFNSGGRQPEVLCDCECGTTIRTLAGNVRTGHTTSCGCASSRYKRLRLTHGHIVGKKATKEYRAWRDMNNRCHRPATKAYENYGGRGIRVCEQWKEGASGAFGRFLADVGMAPTPAHTLDRIDVNGDYAPGNCRWATREQQMRNQRTNRWMTGFGRTQILADWARDLGVDAASVRYWVVLRGLTLEEYAAKLGVAL